MHKSLANVKVVDTAGEGMEPNDNVHVVLGDCVSVERSVEGKNTSCEEMLPGDLAEPVLLVSAVHHATRYFNPGSVSGRDSESVDANGSKLVDSRGVKERLVAVLEDRATLCAEKLTK